MWQQQCWPYSACFWWWWVPSASLWLSVRRSCFSLNQHLYASFCQVSKDGSKVTLTKVNFIQNYTSHSSFWFLLHRCSGAPVPLGFPPVCFGFSCQQSHSSSPPWALLVSIVYWLCGGCPHRGRDPLPAVGVALQPLAEVPPSQGQQ